MVSGTKVTADQVEAILDRIKAGEPSAAIAADLGLSMHTVDRYARKHGAHWHRMPGPVASLTSTRPRPEGDTEWQASAKCGGILGFTNMTVREQMLVCQGKAGTGPECEVRAECLAHGLKVAVGGAKGDEGDVYGGLSPGHVAKLQRQQRERGRWVSS